MTVSARIRQRFGRMTEPARSRAAGSVFFLGSAPLADRMIVAATFSLTSGQWADNAQRPEYFAALEAGLERCKTPTRVLDLGTGAGGSAALLASRYPEAHVVGVDASRTMLRRARADHRATNLTFHRAQVTRLPFANASFDLVILLHAVGEPVELQRVSTPGAQLLSATNFVGPRPDRSAWVGRWAEVGFVREAATQFGSGSWELYRRED